MIEIKIGKNESEQRLDRFLKKYFKQASLNQIYKMIRRDVKVNKKRASEKSILKEDDIVTVYISQEEFYKIRVEKKAVRVRKNFKVVYEDRDILVVSKPFGLLTHGDRHEKKNHLTNQVINYLIEKGDYIPAKEKTFTPSPGNRLDRNTTGLVIFGKNAESLKLLNKKIKNRSEIGKFYLTVVYGEMKEELYLRGSLIKNEKTNKVEVFKNNLENKIQNENLPYDMSVGKEIETVARPLAISNNMTLVEVELVTGRTHQIRAHLAANGFSIIGDVKYGDYKINKKMKNRYNLTTQLLHAYKIILDGKTIEDKLPPQFKTILDDNFKKHFD